jgi:alkanesulfonate monooxygenase SsuD/methylene tetrahydromethanopterin reductase-like flavin-dependent oxidoreductase (luciferase family)
MRFGVLQFFSWPGRKGDLADVYQRALNHVEIMDQTGYDCVWLAEHHFNDFSVCPSVHMMGVECAARTTNLRIGTAISLVGFAHPLRIAEEAALLDVLSGGRLNFGAGRGSDPTEHAVFGVAPDGSHARFREHLTIVLEAWRNQRLTYHSDNWDFDDVEVLPKPLQQPLPPVWAAASSPGAIDWAAGQGHNILMDPHSTHADIGLKLDQYRAGLAAAGHHVEGRTLPVGRLICVAPSDAEAETVARKGAQWTVGAYANSSRGNVGVDIRAVGSTDSGLSGTDPVGRYVDNVMVWGSPARVVDELQRLESEIGIEYLLASPMSQQTFGLLTDEVLPKLL